MIYVLKTKNADPSFIKVGFAQKSLAARIKALKTGCPYDLELIFAKNGTLKDERGLHLKLEEYRSQGEWYYWRDEVRAILNLPLNPSPINPESPGTFLTPRQKQINHLFRKGHSYQLYVHTLDMFLDNHVYTVDDLKNFPPKKARFHIFESTIKEVRGHFGAIIYSKGDCENERKLFISALETPNWNNL